ncbi:hypothetical protein CDAR_185221 [Caerostris darwini]|uniref:Uncharacterized protein n=1 Tax=Caerostris darwini TaxID=1538125 RepID=A0AAV4SNW7_9ARAC|nr:hypothetical protein CDAR_185221 [Caerostris darwini]
MGGDFKLMKEAYQKGSERGSQTPLHSPSPAISQQLSLHPPSKEIDKEAAASVVALALRPHPHPFPIPAARGSQTLSSPSFPPAIRQHLSLHPPSKESDKEVAASVVALAPPPPFPIP